MEHDSRLSRPASFSDFTWNYLGMGSEGVLIRCTAACLFSISFVGLITMLIIGLYLNNVGYIAVSAVALAAVAISFLYIAASYHDYIRRRRNVVSYTRSSACVVETGESNYMSVFDIYHRENGIENLCFDGRYRGNEGEQDTDNESVFYDVPLEMEESNLSFRSDSPNSQSRLV